MLPRSFIPLPTNFNKPLQQTTRLAACLQRKIASLMKNPPKTTQIPLYQTKTDNKFLKKKKNRPLPQDCASRCSFWHRCRGCCQDGRRPRRPFPTCESQLGLQPRSGPGHGRGEEPRGEDRHEIRCPTAGSSLRRLQ